MFLLKFRVSYCAVLWALLGPAECRTHYNISTIQTRGSGGTTGGVPILKGSYVEVVQREYFLINTRENLKIAESFSDFIAFINIINA